MRIFKRAILVDEGAAPLIYWLLGNSAECRTITTHNNSIVLSCYSALPTLRRIHFHSI